MRSLSILLCGYGWFAGIPEGETNNAERIARALDGEILVRLFLNERDATLPLPAVDGKYYRWSVLRPYLESLTAPK